MKGKAKTSATRAALKAKQKELFPIQWPKLAKYVSEILESIPTGPNLIVKGLLSSEPGVFISPEDPPGFEGLEEKLGKLQRVSEYINKYSEVTEFPDFTSNDGDAVIRAYVQIRKILENRWITPQMRRELPIDIAAIARSVAAANRANAKQKRSVDRRSPLAIAVAKERNSDKHATAYEVLNRLTGGDVVKEVKDDRVHYWEGDILKSVGLDRFLVIFSEQKPSMG